MSIDISTDGRTVWVNGPAECLGRLSENFAEDFGGGAVDRVYRPVETGCGAVWEWWVQCMVNHGADRKKLQEARPEYICKEHGTYIRRGVCALCEEKRNG